MGANALIAFGTLCCWAAYGSEDPSGVQYVFLYLGAYIAAGAGIGVVALRLLRVVPTANLFMPALTLVVAFLPHVVGQWHSGRALDRIGQNAALCVLGLQTIVAAYALWWLWRGTAEPRTRRRAA